MIGGESGSERRRSYASASDTPSSHLRECCVARAERSDGVAKRHGRRAARALIGCRDKRGRKGDWDVPFRILSVTTLLYSFIFSHRFPRIFPHSLRSDFISIFHCS
ncbi:MAG: hypothetical protein G8D89_22340 [gamma proteobacterium symbiont of Clathrolucina costata]